MRCLLVAITALALAAPSIAAPPVSSPDRAIAAYEQAMGADATGGGFTLPDSSPAAIAKRRKALVAVKTRIVRLQHARLSSTQRLNLKLLDWAVDEQLGIISFDEARLPFDSDGGFDVEPIYVADSAVLTTPQDAAAWLKLLASIPAYYDTNMANARRGVRTHFTQPKTTVERVLIRARAAAANPVDDDILIGPIQHSTLPAQEKNVALAKAEQIVRDQVRPAQKKFVDFLQNDYLPAARPSLSVRSLPDGERYYAWLVKRYTTTDMAPKAIYDLGVSEVKRIRGEMEAAMKAAHFNGDFKAFLVFLRHDPQFYATSREQLLEKASRIAKRIDYQLPHYFAKLPRLTYGVEPVPAAIEDGYTTGRYFPGDPAKGIAGGLMINTSHLDQRPLYELPALELHEGAPGHHIQISLAQEATDLPAFRRNAYYSAFGEGWALYSEWLGQEMGIYRTPYEQFGRLSYEMWRACRLVADTGIHLKGWSEAQAKQCFEDNTALAPHNIDSEVQRYISWPGQALSYKIGEITIQRLRAEAEAKLGACFDERRFHNALLDGGSMPLAILSDQIHAWESAELSKHRHAPNCPAGMSPIQ